MQNRSKIIKFEILSTIFIFLIGTLLHFTFEWSNSNLIVGSFSAVNESTWEHLKLVFFPMFITTVIGYSIFKNEIPNYLCAKTYGTIKEMLFIIIFFYTYTGIIGTNFAILDIASFFIAILLGQYYSYKWIKEKQDCNIWVAISILIIILFSFIIFTFYTPHIGLFKDPVTGLFGIQ